MSRLFESIAQRDNITIESVRTFLTTKHRSINNPTSMPNLELIVSHVKHVASDLLSLRKQP